MSACRRFSVGLPALQFAKRGQRLVTHTAFFFQQRQPVPERLIFADGGDLRQVFLTNLGLYGALPKLSADRGRSEAPGGDRAGNRGGYQQWKAQRGPVSAPCGASQQDGKQQRNRGRPGRDAIAHQEKRADRRAA